MDGAPGPLSAHRLGAEKVNVVSATENHSFQFHQYHLEEMGRVRVRKFCEVEDREVTNDEIGKGYELSKTQIIPITDEELASMPLPTAKASEIVAFVPLESVDPIRIAEGYYLQPSGQVAAKPYKLLREALGRSSKVAVAKYTWSGRERLGLLRVREDVLVLHAMRWPNEIRDPSSLLPPPVELSEGEIDGALALMDSMTREDLEGGEFRDEYTEAVAQVIEAKREHRELPAMPAPEAASSQVVDLMAALRESMQKAQASRGEEAEVHDLPTKKAAAKKTAKKQPAKKTTAKKTTKEASGRRPRSAWALPPGAGSATVHSVARPHDHTC
ncbi:Ku protein [Streptomyces sp. NPDC006132]|uniref:non-homologous end joining protein Ku n=1 Tax=Streptomyces sp. NPDC006132 TaxID=3156732 RepID=UPI0033CC357A